MNRLFNLVLPLIILLTCVRQWAVATSDKRNDHTGAIRSVATIDKFNFRTGSKSTDGLPKEDILLFNKTIDNQGPDIIIQKIQAQAMIKDIVVFKISKAFVDQDSVQVTPAVHFESAPDVPVLSEPKVQKKIASAYRWDAAGGKLGENITVVSSNRVDFEQEVRIPPCKKCVVKAFVRKVKDFCVDYTAYATISEIQGSSTVPTRSTDGEKYNDFIIAVKDRMYVEFGLRTMVDVHCVPMPSCQISTSSQPKADYHHVYESPIQVVPNKPNKSPTIFSFVKNAFSLVMANLG